MHFTPEQELELANHIADYIDDPLGFVQTVFGWNEPGDLQEQEGPDEWQADILRMIGEGSVTPSEALQIAVASGHGIGKANAYTTPVLTPLGWREIGSLKVGDRVATVDGTFTRVVGVFPQGKRDLYRVTLDDGCSVLADADHRWKTTSRSERKHGKPGRVRTTREISESLTFPNGPREGLNHCLPRLAPIQHPKAVVPIEPYLLGVWLGDGSGSGRIATNAEDMDVVAACGHGVVRIDKGSANFQPPGIKPGLQVLGLEGCRSWEKFIPTVYKHGSVAQRTALLQGLLDTDGTIGKNSQAITFDSSSEALADGVSELVRSLGGVARRSGRQGRIDGVDKRWSYRVFIALPEGIAPFRSARKAREYKPNYGHKNKDRTLSRFIKSVEYECTDEAVCISVEHPSSLYVAQDHIVTHNTALVSWIILWFISTRPKCAGVVTANTKNQLVQKTWRELNLWNKRAIHGHWFEWTATKFALKADPDTWFISAVPWSEHNAEAFAGLHAEHVLVVFDEASAVADAIWEVAEGAMTTAGAMWICFGNPTRNTGRFRECFGRFRHRWKTRQIDSRTAKMANKAQIQKWIDDYGEDHDFVRVRVRGEFPSQAVTQFIPSAYVDAAIAREVDEHTALSPRIMGIDVARFGDDQSVILLREGNKLSIIRRFRGLPIDQFAAHCSSAINEFKPDAVFIDGVGVGGGVVDILKGNQFPVDDVVAGSSPMEPKKYFNLRSEMWGKMRDWVRSYAILPDDRELYDDLISIEYGYTTGGANPGAIQLEKKDDLKKRGLASPDIADALAMTFARPVASAEAQAALRSRFEGLRRQKFAESSRPKVRRIAR